MKNKCTLITGGATRIGRMMTEYLANKCDTIIIFYNSSKQESLELVKKYKNLVAIQCDIANNNELISTMNQLLQTYEVDLLVNNASIMKDNEIKNTDYEDLLQSFSVHLFAPFILTQLVANQTQLNGINIINMLDVKVYTNQFKRSGYLLAKKSLADFTKMAALEYAPDCRINGIAIGWLLDPNGNCKKVFR